MKALAIGDLHLWQKQIETRVDNYAQTCLDKLDQICNIINDYGVDFIIQTGDFWNHREYNNEFKSEVNEIIFNSGVPWHALAGNHDLLYKNPDSIYSSDLGPMVGGNLISYARGKNRTFIDAHFMVYGIESYDSLPSIPDEDVQVLVCHHFINITEETFKYRFDKDLSLSTADLRKAFPEARWIISGHDHNFYPTEEADGFIIVRPGSVMRTSSAKENLSRQVQVAVIDFETEHVEYFPLKVSDFRKVFKVERKEINKEVVAEVDSFVEDIESIQAKSSDDVTEYVAELLKPVEKETKDEVWSRLREKAVLQ